MRRAAFSNHELKALQNIKSLLGIDQEAKLPQRMAKALLEKFYSIPHDKRGDVLQIEQHLQLVNLCLRAVDRAETQKTIKADWWLRDIVSELQGTVKSFAASVEATAKA